MRHRGTPTAGRSLRPVAAAAGLAALVAVLASCASRSDPGAAVDAARCPTVLEPAHSTIDWLPARPTIEVGDRLLPDDTPATVVVCEYPGEDGDLTLGRHTSSPGDDDAVASLQAALHDGGVVGPAGGAALCPRQHARYLARFDYTGGSVWVGTAACATTNGRSATTQDFQSTFSAALDALVGPRPDTDAPGDPDGGTPAPTGAPPTDDPFGGHGDPAFDACLDTSPSYDVAIAPSAPVAADVCHKPPSGAPTSVVRSAADATRLSAALRALPTVDASDCRTEGDQWFVDFHGADDLDAGVFVDAGCHTALGSGGTTVHVDDAFLTLLRQLDRD